MLRKITTMIGSPFPSELTPNALANLDPRFRTHAARQRTASRKALSWQTAVTQRPMSTTFTSQPNASTANSKSEKIAIPNAANAKPHTLSALGNALRLLMWTACITLCGLTKNRAPPLPAPLSPTLQSGMPQLGTLPVQSSLLGVASDVVELAVGAKQ